MAILPQCLLVLLFLLKAFKGEEYNLRGLPGQGYGLDINIGHPYQKLKVLIDTGSANLAVASLSSFNITPYFNVANSTTAVDTGHEIKNKFTYSYYEAKIVLDYVQVPSQPLIPEVIAGVDLITVEKNIFYGSDQHSQGILGLGYPRLASKCSDIQSQTWLTALDRERGSPTSFDIQLCGVDERSKPYQYGSFRILDKTTPKTNNNTVFTTPVIRKWWYELGVLSVRVLKNETQEKVGKSTNISVDVRVYEPDIEMCRYLNKDVGLVIDSGTTGIRLPARLYHQVVAEIKEAAGARNIIFDDSYWKREVLLCPDEDMDWSARGLPRLAVDLPLSDDRSSYFTIEIPPESYMHYMSEFKNATRRARCYEFGIELGDTSPALGVVALEGLQVTFDKTHDVIRFQTSDCGPDTRLSGPYKTNKDYIKLCDLANKTIPEAVSIYSLSLSYACWFMTVVVILSLCFFLRARIYQLFSKCQGIRYRRAQF